MPHTDMAALAPLRAEIDRIDDAIHDLLMRRAETVARVAATGAKGISPVRPGREARIITRLLARTTPPLSRRAVVRVWRELINDSSAQQAVFTIAVTGADAETLAREQFGAMPRLLFLPSAAAVIDALQAQQAGLGIVPMPTPEQPWWIALAARPGQVHVVAQLPFWASCAPAAQAMVLSPVPPDPSDRDVSWLALPTDEGGWQLLRVPGAIPPGSPLLPPGAVPLGWTAAPVQE